jgi:hypothetical protein
MTRSFAHSRLLACLPTILAIVVLTAMPVAARASGHGSSSHGESGGHSAKSEEGGHGEGSHNEDEHPDVKSSGIKLGEFKIRSDYPAEAQKSTIRFIIYATVDAEHFDEMERLAEEHEQKIRDEIIITTRLTPLGVFQESDLATFRRRILLRLRRTLPEFIVEQLYVSDFGLIVKSL